MVEVCRPKYLGNDGWVQYIAYFEMVGERGYYFINETYSDFIGPYPTVFEAKINLKEYCEMLNAKHKVQTQKT
jgi:hypothetical protein